MKIMKNTICNDMGMERFAMLDELPFDISGHNCRMRCTNNDEVPFTVGFCYRMFLVGGMVIDGMLDSNTDFHAKVFTSWRYGQEQLWIPKKMILGYQRIESLVNISSLPSDRLSYAAMDKNDISKMDIKSRMCRVRLLTGENLFGKVIGNSYKNILLLIPAIGVVDIKRMDVEDVEPDAPDNEPMTWECFYDTCKEAVRSVAYEMYGSETVYDVVFSHYDPFSGCYIGAKKDEDGTIHTVLMYLDFNDLDEKSYSVKFVGADCKEFSDLYETYHDSFSSIIGE